MLNQLGIFIFFPVIGLSLELQFTLNLKPSLPVCHSKEKLLARKLKVNTNGLIAVKLYACIFVFSSFDTA